MNTGNKPLLNFENDKTSLINSVVVHPTMPVVVSAHEDRQIKFWDLNNGKLRRVPHTCTKISPRLRERERERDVSETGIERKRVICSAVTLSNRSVMSLIILLRCFFSHLFFSSSLISPPVSAYVLYVHYHGLVIRCITMLTTTTQANA